MGVFTTQGYRGKLVDALTGKILDTFADEDIKVSTNILELFDLGEIPGTFTQTMTLPGTKVNNAFFEQYFDISVWEPDLFNTNQKVEAYLDFDSFYLVNGYLQLNKVNVLENKFVDSYEVTLFGIISNFSIDTRSSFLTDLTTLSSYNHTSSLGSITSSWVNGLFNGDKLLASNTEEKRWLIGATPTMKTKRIADKYLDQWIQNDKSEIWTDLRQEKELSWSKGTRPWDFLRRKVKVMLRSSE